MRNGHPPQTLAELIKLDWLIFEHGKLLKQAKKTLSRLCESGSDTAQQLDHIATIQKHQADFVAMRQVLREYFTKSRLGPSFALLTPAANAQSPNMLQSMGQTPGGIMSTVSINRSTRNKPAQPVINSK
jgi:hypothetical protein